MRKILLIFAMLFLSGVVMAQGGASQTLQQVAKYVKSLGRYEVSFALLAGEYSAKGYFRVDGDSYYMTVGTAEVYCDGKVRYEVDNERKEINIDEVDVTSRNVLDNPTRCFDFVGSDYSVKEELSGSGRTKLTLSAEDKDIEGVIILSLDEKTGRPIGLEYELYDERVVIDVISIATANEPVKRFNQSAYRGYEVVDFR
jgi:outer membrane lipoprotein-sorting protein